MEKIPKIIHWCWFGESPLPLLARTCLESWHTYLPDWTIRQWDESTFDIQQHPFCKSAYQQRKFAYVSDYVRAWALLNEGGIYLDSDVEVRQSLTPFLHHDAFTGFELPGYPFTAVWGSVAQHSLAALVLKAYENCIYTADTLPNTVWVSEILCREFGVNRWDDTFQLCTNGVDSIAIYPSTHFCLDIPRNFTIHHFAGSWVRLQNNRIPVKKNLIGKYYLRELASFSRQVRTNTLAENVTMLDLLSAVSLKIRARLRRFLPH